jgi:hypothetical protein
MEEQQYLEEGKGMVDGGMIVERVGIRTKSTYKRGR